MSSTHINYLDRDFNSIKSDLIDYSKSNYPQLSDNFGNDASISSWIVDLLSDCVDSLNYHIDRVFQNTQLSSTTSKSSLMNLARNNGLKVPGAKAGMCEIQFSCVLPAVYTQSNGTNISEPNWNASPLIQRNCTVGAGNLVYTIEDNVDFNEQFNSNGFSNRSYKPRRNANGDVTGYTVTKTVLATAGTRKVYKKVLYSSDITPFMEVILPDTNVMNIESIIFKSSPNITTTPEISEYYVDEEEYQFRSGTVTTYRFFETDSLVDQWRWGTVTNMTDKLIANKYNSQSYVDEGVYRTYKGLWKPLRQKFITEFTDNGYMKIIFGAGVDYKTFPTDATTYAQYRMSSVMNNDMMGVLPKAGWTMYVLYNIGGGIETNVAAGAINTIRTMQTDFPYASKDAKVTSDIMSSVLKTISVTNLTVGITGKDAPSTDEIKNYIKYNTGSQDRCVTLKDYLVKVMEMPPKYGAPFRCSVSEENNKIVLNVLGMNEDGTLCKSIPSTLAENMENYLSHYKTLGDYVEIKSGKIYNIGFRIDAFVDKSYNSADVVANIITTVKDYMDVNKLNMGEDVFMGDLNKEITSLDGVVSLIDLNVYGLSGGNYSTDICPLPTIAEDDSEFASSATVNKIDLDSTDLILLGDNNAMYEIKQPSQDICVRIKQR